MATGPLKIVMFLGSVREGRLGLRVARFMKKQLEQTNHDVVLFDPKEMKFPLIENPLFYYKDRSVLPEWMLTAEKQVKDADAFVIVSAEYNHSIPPALSNMMDYFGASAYSYKPSGIVCYSAGIYGGMRVAMQLRAFLGELGCLSVSNIFGIPEAQKAFDENGIPQNSHMESGAKKLITQLDWHAHAMRNHRNTAGLP
ncbi:2-hydroxy-1,4-benzoquinone reductase [Patella vulgata]|uniref:2-hydroxy-1,4-benzoquinone reductase n=1 Tax=Patella vulgata TaxID=6465 RepID=UPI00217FBD05|nr:2-hydroxy-1,4-benzoquinone reductase [Patella vulgata]XP_050407686.1 2-hydroxy-1,4-benzoquinone reductase [Patella vulgata]XP_050407687.1 2-hydroxy-1,4-benzoquinone reductase [Patella vulgata]XP_050407688.1 2-hydroxy-1,4-benzoquinone reductase [Patella vulgata]XP_050407689.1 2-hydroxy-1,4-benzoquinone reductase [Patella vulgata]